MKFFVLDLFLHIFCLLMHYQTFHNRPKSSKLYSFTSKSFFLLKLSVSQTDKRFRCLEFYKKILEKIVLIFSNIFSKLLCRFFLQKRSILRKLGQRPRTVVKFYGKKLKFLKILNFYAIIRYHLMLNFVQKWRRRP